MEKLGYVRVSTDKQSLTQQLDALRALGVERIFQDKMSGALHDRPGLDALLAYARPGDSVTVVALDRLGRSMSHVLRTVEDLQQRGIIVVSLRENLDLSTPIGTFVAGIMVSLAQYERSLIAERAAAGRAVAKAQGRLTGRPRVLTDDQEALARRMRSSGEAIPTIALALGVSRATIYRVISASASNVLAAEESESA